MKRLEAGRNLAVLLMLAGLAACSSKVPNLVGMTEKEAQDALTKAKLKPGKITEVHGRGTAGKVVEQDPAAGAKPAGETVAMMIEGAGAVTGAAGTSGTPGIAVPDLSGKTLAEAEVVLGSLGLVRGAIKLAASDKPPGTVFDEDPHAGTQTQPGATVDLSIATGSQNVEVPAGIMGQTRAAAEQTLRDAGLQVGTISHSAKPDSAVTGTVVGSNPSAGIQVAKGTPVGLVLKQTISPEAAKGQAIAEANPLVAAIRASEPEGPQREGFDMGMGIWQGNTVDGPGKQAFGKSLTPAEQVGFADAAVFSAQWNPYADVAGKGAAIALKDANVAAARAKAYGSSPSGLSAGLYWLGFDIATGIFGDPKLGAQGNTALGTGSIKIRDSLGRDAQRGFKDSFEYHTLTALKH